MLEYAIIRMGVPLGIAAIGVGLMTANRFISGVVLLYLGLGLFALDIAYEDFFLRWHVAARFISGIIYLLAIAAVSYFWIFIAAPLQVWSSSRVPIWGPGSKRHGIEWLPRYSELAIQIENPTATDYENFDALLSTDLVINRMVQAGGLGQCNLEGVHGVNEPAHWQHVENGKPIGQMDDPRWEYQIVPVDKDGNRIVPFAGADWTYRVRCDRIPANGRVELFGALVVVNEHVYGCLEPCPYPFFDPPRAAKWITMKAEFQTSGRGRTKPLTECPVGGTCEIDGRNKSNR